jgi:rhodanese-related sulfurtransferase
MAPCRALGAACKQALGCGHGRDGATMPDGRRSASSGRETVASGAVLDEPAGMSKQKITGSSTMQEVLEAYPSAQRALFQKYHIGGCSSCGYHPDEPLESVAKNHGIQDVGEVLSFLESSAEADLRMRMTAKEVAEAMRSKNPPKLLDVRTPQEYEAAHIPGATLFTRETNHEMAGWPRDTAIVFTCHTGPRSMDAAAFFVGHGYTNVRYLHGGIEAWSQEIDSTVPRYTIERDPMTRQGVIRPLNSSFQS